MNNINKFYAIITPSSSARKINRRAKVIVLGNLKIDSHSQNMTNGITLAIGCVWSKMMVNKFNIEVVFVEER